MAGIFACPFRRTSRMYSSRIIQFAARVDSAHIVPRTVRSDFQSPSSGETTWKVTARIRVGLS
jgi:hypothetical protein